jgi:3-hydroxyacyl-CoA dehydrogenase
MSKVLYTLHGAIALITLDNPPVNGLSVAVRQGIKEAVDTAAADPAVKAMLLIGKGKFFCAGADIREFGTPAGIEAPMVRHLATQFDEQSKPMVAAIGGAALGGGLEIALACHYRIASTGAKLGLPEVTLGVVASGGGTQRLPRAIPVEIATQMIVSGDSIRSEKGLELGLIDEIITGDLQAGAMAFTERLLAQGKGIRRLSEVTPRFSDKQVDAAAFFAAQRASVAKSSRGNTAPLRVLACAEAAVLKPFEEGRLFAEGTLPLMSASTESKALPHAFFAEREAQKIPDVPVSTPKRPLNSGAVIGAGTMGGGIAMNFANAGIPVVLIEMKQEALDRGMATIRKNYAATVAKGRLSQADMDRRMALITPALDLSAAKDADVIIEAVFERMDVKQEVFRKLDAIAKPGAILASNTSTLDVNRIADVTKRPGDVIGLHFFSPANVMRLLEVVRGARTTKDVLATSMLLAKKMDKIAVVAGVCDGFIGNRMLAKYSQQANFLLDLGALPQQIDGALNDFGMAMGPFTMSDMAGGDIGWETRKRRAAEDPNFTFSKIPDLLCEQGRFGQKTGKGWYRYEAGNRTPLPDPDVAALIADYRRSIGLASREIGSDEIVQRCMYALVNEAAWILEEGIALRASDIDTVYVAGYGFPRHRGGPLFYADTVGLKNVLAAIEGFGKGYKGEIWKPAPLLVKLAKEGKTFN